MKRIKSWTIFALLTGVLLASCTPATTVQTVMITATPVPATPTSAPSPDLEVTLYYEGYAQFELIGSQGRRILIDVHNPNLLTSPPTEDDILLTTHTHEDHYNSQFANAFPGPHILAQEGSVRAPDVTIQGIASAHSANEVPIPAGGSNYIYVIDIDGLRFAHFGDIGQEELSQEQLDALGQVDVAMLLFGGMCSTTEMNSFGLMEQVQPRLMIPTHAAMTSLEHAFSLWDSYYAAPWNNGSYANVAGITISRADLTDEPHFLVMGEWAAACMDQYDLSEW